MGGRVFLNNLRLKYQIGITDEERMAPQEILLDISLAVDLKPASASDDFAGK